MKTARITLWGVVFCLLAVLFLPTPAEALDVSVLDYQKISDIEGNFLGELDDTERFGVAIASIGDLDGDGVTDLAIGASLDDDGGEDRGAVWILFLNPDGTVKANQKISSTEGNFTGILDDEDQFGYAIAFLGDTDGDDVGDIAVSSIRDDDGVSGAGAVWILFLNPDGTVKSHQKISNTEGSFTGILHTDNYFGFSIASLGDFDGDGAGDIAVGAHYDDDGGPVTGAVWLLFLNSDGTVKTHQKISDTEGDFTGYLEDYDCFGSSVTDLGDLDNDGVTDIVVGAFHDDDGGENRGAVWVLFLNADGTVKAHQKISDNKGNFTGSLSNEDTFGVSVASLGDLDGDGTTDIAVGSIRDDDGGGNRGAVWLLFLNSDGTVKTHQKISDIEGGFEGILDNNDHFGLGAISLDGLDGNLIPNIAVGAIGDDDGGLDRGAVWILFLDMDLYEVAANKIETAIGKKEDSLAKIEAALEQERDVMEILEFLQQMYDNNEPQSRKLRRAKHGIRLAIVRERISRILLKRSIRDLERALGNIVADEEPAVPAAARHPLRRR